MAATYSPDGTRIAVSSSDQRSFKIWDAATLTEVALLGGGKYAVESAAFAPDGTRIVAASYPDKNLKIFDAASGKVVAARSGHAEAVKAVAYSPDGKRIVSGSYDKTLRVWDTQTLECLAVFPCHAYVMCCAHSPRGTRISCGDEGGGVYLLDLLGAGR